MPGQFVPAAKIHELITSRDKWGVADQIQNIFYVNLSNNKARCVTIKPFEAEGWSDQIQNVVPLK